VVATRIVSNLLEACSVSEKVANIRRSNVTEFRTILALPSGNANEHDNQLTLKGFWPLRAMAVLQFDASAPVARTNSKDFAFQAGVLT
jgi:hypothetical protein